MTYWQLSACDAADKIGSGEISSADLVGDCLERITGTDSQIGAWACVNHDLAISQAEAMDGLRKSGRALGRLHGVPVGLADVFDLKDMPTGWRQASQDNGDPVSDSALVDRLREAGAVCLGKTSATVLDTSSHSSVRNPYNSERTAGSAAAGSAAAVAAGHVPLAVALQSNGSVITSASYCGVYGFKPTRGMISRRGCLQTSPTLDQIGVLGRSLQDIAVLADALSVYDPFDAASFPRPRPRLSEGYLAKPPVEPCFAWVELPYFESLPDATRQGFEELIEALGDRVEQLPAPKSFAEIGRHHKTIQDYEFAKSIDTNPDLQPAQLEPALQAIRERAQAISINDYNLALAMLAGAEQFFASFFYDYDAVIAPSSLGEARKLGESEAEAACSTIWTFAGLPCLSAPWLTGETGLPVGVQLIGSAEEDDRLLRTAAWLERHLDDGPIDGA